jgi:hypothetical protein
MLIQLIQQNNNHFHHKIIYFYLSLPSIIILFWFLYENRKNIFLFLQFLILIYSLILFYNRSFLLQIGKDGEFD